MPSQELVDLIVLEQMPIQARGRHAAPLVLEYDRDIGPAELALLLSPPKIGSTTPALKSLRHTHHMAARLLAEGKTPTEVSVYTGYSSSRISILQDDPAFAELVSYYHQNVVEQYVDVHQRLASLGLTTIEELQERLDQSPNAYSNRELMDLAELALDRSLTPNARAQAPGPGAGSVNGLTLNVNFVASKQDSVAPTIELVKDK